MAFHPGHAHSPDNVVVHLPQHDLVFGGCMLMAGDRVGNRAVADVRKWPAAVKRLLDLPAETVVPGHGERFDRWLLKNTLDVLEADLKGN